MCVFICPKSTSKIEFLKCAQSCTAGLLCSVKMDVVTRLKLAPYSHFPFHFKCCASKCNDTVAPAGGLIYQGLHSEFHLAFNLQESFQVSVDFFVTREGHTEYVCNLLENETNTKPFYLNVVKFSLSIPNFEPLFIAYYYIYEQKNSSTLQTP